MCYFFLLKCLVARVIGHVVIFVKIKVIKHIWDPCCHLAAENDSRFITDLSLINVLFPPAEVFVDLLAIL